MNTLALSLTTRPSTPGTVDPWNYQFNDQFGPAPSPAVASQDVWDLVIDASGNLAISTGGIALAQDVASAVRTFRGECWYDTTLGVPYYNQIFGQRVSLQFLKQSFIAQGLTVPDVASIACFLTGPGLDRVIGGQLQITSTNGTISVAQTGNLLGVVPWWVNSVEGSNTSIDPWNYQFGNQFGPA